MYDEYEGYQLDVDKYELTDKDKMILDNAILLVDNVWSLRTLSRNVLRSKSQLSRDFQKPLRQLSYELYQIVRKRLERGYGVSVRRKR